MGAATPVLHNGTRGPSRVEELGAEIVMPRHRNPPDGDGGPHHWEIWLRDPDGYVVVLASPDGSAGGSA